MNYLWQKLKARFDKEMADPSSWWLDDVKKTLRAFIWTWTHPVSATRYLRDTWDSLEAYIESRKLR